MAIPAGERRPLLSVVVPVFNEEPVIDLLHSRVVDVLGARDDIELEIVYVDDGSSDRSLELLERIAEHDRRVSVVALSRNFGHQPAVTAGLRTAQGDIVAIIDADLQDPVELIPEMIGKWRDGYSVVYGVRRNRKESRRKVAGYWLFYRLLSRLSEIEVPHDSGDFCLLDRAAVDAINRLPEKNRFVRGLRAWYGGRQIGLPYDRPARVAGETHYSARKLLKLAFDGIFNFSVLPLRLIFWLGLATSLLSALALIFFVIHRIIGFKVFGYTPADVPGFSSVILSVLFLSGVQLLSVGVLGEYLGRIYLEVKARPEYVIGRRLASRYGADDASPEHR